MTNFNNLVPGGGLTAHEAVGGHTLARHVGQTPAQLTNRLVNQNRLPSVSSFTDRVIAEEAIATTINANSSAITAWLNICSAKNLTIRYRLSEQLGIVLDRATNVPIPANQVVVVLCPSPSLPLGYYILTAYLEP